MINLYKHQEEALEAVKGQPNCAFYLDMGLGKTFVGSEKMKEYNKRVNLVICQKSKVNDWVQHFQEHYSMYVCNLTDKHGFDFYLKYCNFSRVGIINYELAWRRKDLLKLTDFTLMLDESSIIQNRKTKQTKFVMDLKPSHVILLSGTPTAGKYENLWTQCHLLGWDISERLYQSQFVNWELVEFYGVKHRVVKKSDPYKNTDRLKSKLREHGAVFQKTEDVFDLPDQSFISVDVKPPKQYKRFLKTGYVEVDGLELIGDTTLTKRLYTRQLCGMFNDNKESALIDLLNSTQDRVIIFYNFVGELESLKRACGLLKRPYSQINGSVKDLYNYEHESDSVTLIQYQSGAMGLNLQKANKTIYYSLPERSDLFEQSKARTHRIGQNRPCFYYVMLSGIEYQIYDVLKERKDWTDELFIKAIGE